VSPLFAVALDLLPTPALDQAVDAFYG
jgi:hypothetical protein